MWLMLPRWGRGCRLCGGEECAQTPPCLISLAPQLAALPPSYEVTNWSPRGTVKSSGENVIWTPPPAPNLSQCSVPHGPCFPPDAHLWILCLVDLTSTPTHFWVLCPTDPTHPTVSHSPWTPVCPTDPAVVSSMHCSARLPMVYFDIFNESVKTSNKNLKQTIKFLLLPTKTAAVLMGSSPWGRLWF